jgi:N-acetyl-beta-hexosaminidase
MVLPRLAAISETAWAYDRKDSYEDFTVRAKALLPRLYKSYGYNYAPYFFEDVE